MERGGTIESGSRDPCSAMTFTCNTWGYHDRAGVLFQRVVGPKGQLIGPKGHWFEGSLVRRIVGQKGRWSEITRK